MCVCVCVCVCVCASVMLTAICAQAWDVFLSEFVGIYQEGKIRH